MPQIFNPSTNVISKASIFGAVFIVIGAGFFLDLLSRSSWATGQHVIKEQPVAFSHAHHVADCGIDCRYCHSSVETSAFAGMPSTATCMSCHKELWADSPMLEPVRESFRTGKPLRWTRVHDLPDFVYFNHSIHVAKGIGCASCHGPVDRMPLMWQSSSLLMEWCLDCHRDPTAHVRPREAVFDMAWKPDARDPNQATRLAKAYELKSATHCTTCHR